MWSKKETLHFKDNFKDNLVEMGEQPISMDVSELEQSTQK